MAVQHFGVGDLVHADDLAGTWIIDRISSGRALLRRADDGRELSRLVSDLTLVRAATVATEPVAKADDAAAGEESLF